MKFFCCLIFAFFAIGCTSASTPPSPSGFDADLTQFQYPYPVAYFKFQAQQQDLKMAYMDVNPLGKNTIVLFHGKNFSGYYFAEITKVLLSKDYRVIIIDQIGFGKSSKPQHFQYSLHALASYSEQLLASLHVQKFSLLGHSMGGMLATRFALMFPEQVQKLYLIDPIGLEDWKTMTSYHSVDQLFAAELNNSTEKVRQYQIENYYGNQWKPEYEKYITPYKGWLEGPDYARIAWSSALTTDMLFTQPVVYEFKNLITPTVLVIGSKDKTAIGKSWATTEMRSKMGNYPAMAQQVTKAIPNAKLIVLDGLGHTPFIENPDLFWKELLPEF